MKNDNCLLSSVPSIALLLLLSTLLGHAAIRHWDGSSSINWSTGANWSNSVAPVAGDTLIFPTSGANKTNSNNFASGTVFGDLRLTDDYVLNGNRINLTNGIFLSNPVTGTATAIINHDVTLTRDQTFTANSTAAFSSSRLSLRSILNLNGRQLDIDGAGTVELAGTIIGAGELRVVGPGTLVISNASTFDGYLSASEGMVRLAASLPGVRLGISQFGGSVIGTGRVASVSSAGGLSPGFNGPGVIDCGTNLTFFGVGGSTLTMQLNGTQPGTGYDQLRVNGPFNSISGPPTTELLINLGFAPALGDSFTIVENTSAFVPHAFITFEIRQASTTERRSYEGATYSTNGYSFRISFFGGDGNDVVLTTIRTPSSPISYWDGGETNDLWTSAKNWVGDAAPSAGHHLHFTAAASNRPTNNFAPGTTFASISFAGAEFPVFSASNFVLRGNAIALTGGITNAHRFGTNVIELNLTLAPTQTVLNTGLPFTLAGQLSGNSTLIKQGSGEVILSGPLANSYSGSTFVNAGVVRLAKSAGVVAIPGALTIANGSGTASAIYSAAGQIADGFPVTVNAGGTLDLNGHSLTVSALTLAGGAVQTGAGEMTLGGNVLANSSTVLASISGRLNLFGQVLGFNIADGPLSTDLSVTAAMTNGGLNKLGAGTLALTGNNSYAGPTTVSNGRLLVNGTQPASAITVNNGTLGGSGIIGPLTMNSGILSPGNSPGILRIIGNMTLSGATTLIAEFNGLIPGTGHDQLIVTGAVDLAGATLLASVGFAATPGNTLTLIANDGTDPISGRFVGLPEGAALSLNGQAFSLSYVGGTGNDVVLTRVDAASLGGSMKLGNGQFQFQGMGENGLSYLVQATTNIGASNWVNLGIVPANGSGSFQFLDTNAPLFPLRFYRALSQ